jgi:hypothetical protein
MLSRALGRGGCSGAGPELGQAGEDPNGWNVMLQPSKKPDFSHRNQQGVELDLHAVPTTTRGGVVRF